MALEAELAEQSLRHAAAADPDHSGPSRRGRQRGGWLGCGGTRSRGCSRVDRAARVLQQAAQQQLCLGNPLEMIHNLQLIRQEHARTAAVFEQRRPQIAAVSEVPCAAFQQQGEVAGYRLLECRPDDWQRPVLAQLPMPIHQILRA